MRETTTTPLRDLKTVTILFDEVDTSHSEVINQFVEKMVKAKFAKKKEIIEHLLIADLLVSNDNRYENTKRKKKRISCI